VPGDAGGLGGPAGGGILKDVSTVDIPGFIFGIIYLVADVREILRR
jgi:hypothetical protein